MIAEQYDVVIMGGGVYGAALFWEASLRGARALLVEKQDFAGGTSANGLNLVSGGIFELTRLNPARVREFSEERRVLTAIAPHLVRPMPFLMPIGQSGFAKRRWFASGALKIYDMLTLDRNRGLDPARHYGRSHLLGNDFTATIMDAYGDTFHGAASWFDGQVQHPQRLVLSFIMAGQGKGGHALNYAYVTGLETRQGRVEAVTVQHEPRNQSYRVQTAALVDCTGPWSQETLADLIPGWTPPPQRHVRAVSFVIPRQLGETVVCLSPGDPVRRQQQLFIAPWWHASLIGTWYLEDQGVPGAASWSDDEIETIINEINMLVPALRMRREEITLLQLARLPARGGACMPEYKARIAPAADSGGPAGLFSVQGAPLTMARRAAVKAMESISAFMKTPMPASQSHATPLYGGAIESMEDFLQQRFDEYVGRYGEDTLLRLFRIYGSTMDAILMLADQQPDWSGPIPGVEDSLTSELHYILAHEHVETLSDLVLRRTDLGTQAMPGKETLNYCLAVMAAYKSWDASDKIIQLSALKNHYPAWHTAAVAPQERPAPSSQTAAT